MIIRGGENIQPLEIEDFVRKKSEVEDCYVVGVPSIRSWFKKFEKNLKCVKKFAPYIIY